MNWYQTLDVNTRINLKECFKLLCGSDFSQIGKILSLRERIDLIYFKLKKEGFDV